MSAESLANRLKSDLPWKVINYVRSTDARRMPFAKKKGRRNQFAYLQLGCILLDAVVFSHKLSVKYLSI